VNIQPLLSFKCMVVCLLTLVLHSVLVPFIRIYLMSFVNKFNFVNYICRNPSFGLATKAKGIARVRAKRKPGS